MSSRRNNNRPNHRDHHRANRPSAETVRRNQAVREAYHRRLNTPGMGLNEPNQIAINETARRINDLWNNEPDWDRRHSLRRELQRSHTTAPGLAFEDEIMIFSDGYASNRAEVMRRELEHRMRNGEFAPLPVRLPVQNQRYMYADFGIGEQLSREAQRRLFPPIERTSPPDLGARRVGRLPKRALTVEDQDEDGEATCHICQESIDVGTQVTTLPCQHWFCTECLKPWLRTSDTCPTCRASITGQRHERNEIEQDGRDLLDFLSEILSLFE